VDLESIFSKFKQNETITPKNLGHKKRGNAAKHR